MSRGGREERLDALAEEARREGRVAGRGAPVSGGPLPPAESVGYHGRPVLKEPVWTWEVPLYLFLGGLAGMAAVIAAVALFVDSDVLLARAALRLAALGALLSPLLLTLDLGRPRRFLAMLRVFKPQSPMSVGVWTLLLFSLAVVPAWALVEGYAELLAAGWPRGAIDGALRAALVAGGLAGALLATYPGVLLGATAIPAWSSHRSLLPLHFGLAGLGSAAGALELAGFVEPALGAVGLAVAAVETGVGGWVELRRLGAIDLPLHSGRSGLLLRAAGVLAGPAALALRLGGAAKLAAAAFLVGALVSRYGWIAAGRASARDPRAVLRTGAGGV